MPIVTGLEVHGGDGLRLMELTTSVALHDAFAVVLMLNGFLALFYHLTTKAIRARNASMRVASSETERSRTGS